MDSQPSVAPFNEALSAPATPPARAAEPERRRFGALVAPIIGAVAGALAFFLLALFVGSLPGVAVALAALALATRRGERVVLVAYGLAAGLSALAIPFPLVMLGAAASFGAGLFLQAHRTPHSAES